MKSNLMVIIMMLYMTKNVPATIIQVPYHYPSIQEGINIAADGDTILVQPGTYYENINFNGKNVVVGSLYLFNKEEKYILQTIIDGGEKGSVVTFENGEESKSILCGFTITNGKDDWSGGGIYCENASPTLKYLIIKDNQASGGGGIFCIDHSSPYIQNVLITNNYAEKGGGLMSMSNSQPTLANVTIINNNAEQGNGILSFGTKPFIHNSLIRDGIDYSEWTYNTILNQEDLCRAGR